ncbi:MAG: DUF4012 domain-containing protein [Candidatus Doudnabacteria bacterium]|nr:DUF4012 domain-containing protein [Candidatus Doudnabacteria bacterium]
MRKEQFKIYFHQHYFHKLIAPKRQRGLFKTIFSALFYAVRFLFLGLYGLCYLVGEGVLLFLQKAVTVFIRDVIKTKEVLLLRAKRANSRDFLANHVSLTMAVICIGILFSGFGLFAQGLELKENVLNIFGQGKTDLETAQALLKEQKTEAARQSLYGAMKNFQAAQNHIKQTNTELKLILSFLPQGADAKKILEASEKVSEGGQSLLVFYENFKLLKFTPEGISSAEENQKVLQSSEQEVKKATASLRKASELLSSINIKSVPENYRAEFLQAKKLAENVSGISQTFEEIFSLFNSVLSHSSNILLVLQNNNELRPSGGFIGSFAAIKQSYGKMSSIKLGSIYDLDGQLKDKILPPMPMFAVNDRWYLRDSNWFLDFKKSAKKITEFYEKEGGETPDLVVALTPNLIIDLLKITGPVELPKYKILLDSENFVERTQVLTEMDMTTPENTPKQFLADLMPVLLERLGRVKFEQFDQLTESLFKNLSEKHLQIYSRYENIQERLEAFNWAGRVYESDSDYLAVVSSNLGGTKTDLYVEQSIKLDVRLEEDKAVKELTLTFKNTLPELENTFNKRFIRIMVPKNSKLKSVRGFDYVNLERPDAKDYKIDPDAKEWDENTSRNIVTGTLVGEESGKTFFGNWLTLKGGQERVVKIVYETPLRYEKFFNYSLLLQKQPGAEASDFELNIFLGGKKLIWSSDGMVVDGLFKLKFILNQDRLLGLVLQQP